MKPPVVPPDRFSFILSHPRNPENVGAAARALKTMGFTRLRLVAPCDHRGPRARALAHEAGEILDSAEMFESLGAALADADLSIATTVRRRHHHAPALVPADEIPDRLHGLGAAARRIALVFGNEEHGLANEELDLCDWVSFIPLAQPQPSLNLAQAVMVYAYVLSGLGPRRSGSSRNRAGAEGEFRKLKERASLLFDRLEIPAQGLFRRKAWKRMALLSIDDMRLMHYFISKGLLPKTGKF